MSGFYDLETKTHQEATELLFNQKIWTNKEIRDKVISQIIRLIVKKIENDLDKTINITKALEPDGIWSDFIPILIIKYLSNEDKYFIGKSLKYTFEDPSKYGFKVSIDSEYDVILHFDRS